MAVVVIALALASIAAAERGLLYRLDVGDRLIFRARQRITSLDNGTLIEQSHEEARIWCLAREGDELLVLVERERIVGDRKEPLLAAVLYLGDGARRRIPDAMAARLVALYPALDMLPVLPSGAQLDAEWRTPPDLFQRRWHCVRKENQPADNGLIRVEFAVEDALCTSDLLGQKRAGLFWFDSAEGLVARLESVVEDKTAGVRISTIGRFHDRVEQSRSWCTGRAEEARRYLRSLAHEDRLLLDVTRKPDDFAGVVGQLDKLWLGFRSDVDDRAMSPFAAIAEGRREVLRAARAALAQYAELGRRWHGKPALKWTLQDAGGKTVRCEELRKGVMIECFWSGESIWGIRSLESMRRLQAALPPGRLRLVCLNFDERDERARELIRRCGGPGPGTKRRKPQPLTHVLAGPLRIVETLPEVPVVRVLDGKGVVRGIWIGWHPDYAPARELAAELAGVRRP